MPSLKNLQMSEGWSIFNFTIGFERKFSIQDICAKLDRKAMILVLPKGIMLSLVDYFLSVEKIMLMMIFYNLKKWFRGKRIGCEVTSLVRKKPNLMPGERFYDWSTFLPYWLFLKWLHDLEKKIWLHFDREERFFCLTNCLGALL